jgi:hypothetical protein
MIAASEFNRGRDLAMFLPREMMGRGSKLPNRSDCMPVAQLPV